MMLRWLNPESIKIYARASVNEKVHWVDEIFKVRSVDAARTTTVNAVAGTDIMYAWEKELGATNDSATQRATDSFDERAQATQQAAQRPQLAKGERISVYWTEMDAWFSATHMSTRKAYDNDGNAIYESHLIYDATGAWTRKQDLTYWHCLDDEQWEKI